MNRFIWKEPANALTHFAGFIAAIIGLVILLQHSPTDNAKIAGFAIYGASLIVLFLSSSSYHFFDFGENGNLWLRKGDHAAIFLLIAGTYIPAIIHLLDGAWRFWMLVSISTLAVMGVLFKFTWFHCPRWLDAVIYLAMGWMIVIPGARMFEHMTRGSLALLISGGLLYSLGAVVYATKKPNPWPGTFGFHEIWHCFVLAAAASHFGFMYSLIDQPYVPF